MESAETSVKRSSVRIFLNEFNPVGYPELIGRPPSYATGTGNFPVLLFIVGFKSTDVIISS